ncbi:MAG: hypothetical protein FWD57_14735, partial [Polyangiaceae bacterium]|nr:hypothetical protein [Polyangiaceae bacterium]
PVGAVALGAMVSVDAPVVVDPWSVFGTPAGVGGGGFAVLVVLVVSVPVVSVPMHAVEAVGVTEFAAVAAEGMGILQARIDGFFLLLELGLLVGLPVRLLVVEALLWVREIARQT